MFQMGLVAIRGRTGLGSMGCLGEEGRVGRWSHTERPGPKGGEGDRCVWENFCKERGGGRGVFVGRCPWTAHSFLNTYHTSGALLVGAGTTAVDMTDKVHVPGAPEQTTWARDQCWGDGGERSRGWAAQRRAGW